MKIYSIDRKTVISDRYDLSVLDGLKEGRTFEYAPSRHEYYVVQLAVLTGFDALVEVKTGPLKGANKNFDKAVTCFNSEGVGADGKKFTRPVGVNAGAITVLLIGVDLSRADIDEYRTDVYVDGEKVELVFKLTDKLVFNEGTDDGSTLARLKWLNSTEYMDKKLVPGFHAISADKNSVTFTGKRATFTGDGFINDVESYYSESNALTDEVTASLFFRPMEFIAEGQKFKYNRIKITDKPDSALIVSDGKSEKLHIAVNADAHYEGVLHYTVTIDALEDAIVEDIRLNAYFASADYGVGMGMAPGRLKDLDYKWTEVGGDYIYIGNVNCGARIRLRENRDKCDFPVYGAPLETGARPPKTTWANYGKGGVTVRKTDEGALFSAYTGKMIFAKGDKVSFCFDMHLTPFRPLDLRASAGNRIYTLGQGGLQDESARASRYCATSLSVGRPSAGNTYVKSVQDDVKALKKLTLVAHKRNIACGLEYGINTLGSDVAEYYALMSLDGEIMFDRFRTDFGEFGHIATASRFDNYYVESLKRLICVADIDFVSMHNPSLTPTVAERIQKCMTRKRGGGFTELVLSDRSGVPDCSIDTLSTYADVLPFVSKVAVKGYGDRDLDSALIGVSGIPYGFTVDSLSPVGICRSLLIGMLPCVGEDDETTEAIEDLNRVLRDFDIGNAEFKGYWDKTNPVRADNASIYCTSYINGKDMIAVLYNDSEEKKTFEIGIENKLGFTTVGKKVRCPEIRNMQKGRPFNLGKAIKLAPRAGLIFIVKSK